MNDIDFTFAWEGAAESSGPWNHLRVAQLRGTEEISCLYRYEILALAREPAPEVDPEDLILSRCTLRIATLTEPAYKVIHGIITDAEEVGPVHGGMLYRFVLMPPLVRASHRKRSRIFLDKTTRDIIDSVLQGDPSLRRADHAAVEPDDGSPAHFAPAKELYAWRVRDTSRIDQIAARSYCAQYNETDFAFLCRLLEEDGITYHYENGDDVCLLVLSDKDEGRMRLEPFLPLGPEIGHRSVSSMKLGARMRPRRVTLKGYNWKRPALDMNVQTPEGEGSELFSDEYPGRYPDAPSQGMPLATAMLERYQVEARYALGEGSCRLLSAGSIFALEHPTQRYNGEYLVTKVEARGEQQGVLPPSAGFSFGGIPYTCAIECVRRGGGGRPAESKFRPARVTPRPRIQGSQTAFVTAEPSMKGAEIHVGGPPGAEIGCVRLRFHWDQDLERHAKEPTSCWVRVSQMFAGVGEGGVFHPRVGVEVIVDFEDGDPDRPIVVGRVYNGANRPPGGATTSSTFKTMTSPADGTYNELSFEDSPGNQQIKLHTPRDWNSEVGNDRRENVAMSSGSNVGANRSESTGANRSTMIGGNNSELVGGNESITVGANQISTIGGNQQVTIEGWQSLAATGAQSLTSDATQTFAAREQELTAAGSQRLSATNLSIKTTSTSVENGSLDVLAGAVVITSGSITITGGAIAIQGGAITVTGAKIDAHGGTVNVDGGAVINMKAAVIKMN